MTGLRKAVWLSFWASVVTYGSWAQDIRSTYAANCANCHGADGRGNTALGRVLKLRDLRSPEVQRLSDDELQAILSKGTDRGRMPGFQKKLGSDIVQELAAYLRKIETEPVPIVPAKQTTHSKTNFDPQDIKSVYSVQCSHCHGVDGAGDSVLGRNLKLRDMRSDEAQKFSDDEMVQIIAHGTDRGRMPGFRKKLGDDIVEQLASYVRGLAGKPPVEVTKKATSPASASEVTPSEPAKPTLQLEAKTPSIVLPEPEKDAKPQEQASPGETHKASPLTKLPSAVIPARKTGPSNPPVDLNSASKETLMTLPWITEADAASIIAGRPYKSSLQFKTRMIVSPDTYAKISGRVVAKKPVRTAQQPVSDKDAK